MKTLELTGPALNYAVAVALGYEIGQWHCADGAWYAWIELVDAEGRGPAGFFPGDDRFQWETNWAAAGPLLDAANIDIKVASDVPRHYKAELAWAVPCPTGGVFWARATGPTRLTAGLRCLVRSKLGDEVDIPKEITC